MASIGGGRCAQVGGTPTASWLADANDAPGCSFIVHAPIRSKVIAHGSLCQR